MDKRTLEADHFAAFFRDVHGEEPFPWQMRLTAQVLACGAWPKVIDLPTGTGKTAVLDTAVFALAAKPTVFPRRIVFVIDRRIVVDQVFERACRISHRVRNAETPVLRYVKNSLAALSDGELLGVAALRGGIPRDGEWADRPDQPWVMVSTVDQFGSRLLFRGYGVSGTMRPIHAGLAGNDCLVILDEVHLSVPFAETLAQVSVLQSERLPRRFSVVEMSATPSDDEAERFGLEVDDLEGSAELRRRVEAAKRAELVPVRDHDTLPAKVGEIVGSITKTKPGDTVRSLGVVVNRVRTARDTHRVLEEMGHEVHLVTGRMRPLDRLDVLDRIGPAVAPSGATRPDELTIVVATQAIEVGADFSFDALITECAAVDSLRQRFGRLDRRGTRSEQTGQAARAWIVGPKSVIASKRPDPIYGEAIKVTWEELERRAKVGPVDIGSRALLDFPPEAAAPKDKAPLLLKTHMDAWAQTDPEPLVQPSPEQFLHGIKQNRTADVSILWRWDHSADALRLVPPRQAEFLQVPMNAAKSWLAGGREVDVADVAHGPGVEEHSPIIGDSSDDWVRWAGFGKEPEQIGITEIRPGDILIVNPDRGGLLAGTWDPASKEHIEDLGDIAQFECGRRATLRLDPRLLSGVADLPLPKNEAEADTPARERIKLWLDDLHETDPGKPTNRISKIIDRLLGEGFKVDMVSPREEDPTDSYYVLTERSSDRGKPVVDWTLLESSNESGSMTGSGVTLESHLEGVGDRAGQFAERLGLVEFADDLRLVGLLHDLGKVDRRFQAGLVGGDPIALEMLEQPLAKSLPGVPRGRGGYPRGMRHEVASVAMVESNYASLEFARDRDLVLYLIGTHHGHGRPLPPLVEDPEPQTLDYIFNCHALRANSDLVESPLALDMADRFWRLLERYGYYGLAWLEAILRLADYRQSEEEEAGLQ